MPEASKIFPINANGLTKDSVAQVKTFAEKVRSLKCTNMEVFVDYCLELIEK